jgi:hypothetical protein
MQTQEQHLTNVVSQTAEKELTLHGIRMASKAMVVELCALNKALDPEQLHVAPIDEAISVQTLSELTSEQRKNFAAPIWYSIAQALKYFSKENSGFCVLKPENIHIDENSHKIYLTNWLTTSNTESQLDWIVKRSDSSIEQMYLTQLSVLYHFLLSGESLFDKLQDVEKSSWQDEHIKNAIKTLDAEPQLKNSLLRAVQLNGGFYTNINAFSESVSPFFYIMEPKGFLPFLSGTWIAFSAITSVTFLTFVLFYAHTLS